jgi:hypothetical protein
MLAGMRDEICPLAAQEKPSENRRPVTECAHYGAMSAPVAAVLVDSPGWPADCLRRAEVGFCAQAVASQVMVLVGVTQAVPSRVPAGRLCWSRVRFPPVGRLSSRDGLRRAARAHGGDPQASRPAQVVGRGTVRAASVPPRPGRPRPHGRPGASGGSGRAWGVLAAAVLGEGLQGPAEPVPAGHLIMALSSSPPDERTVNRHLTSAGSPQRTAPFRSIQAGQSRNIIVASIHYRVRVRG